MPKVTIALPVYNQEDTIAEAIDSCLMQAYEDVEILIIDDDSTDKTRDICREYVWKYTRINLRVVGVNQGFAGNMTELVAAAQGEYIVFLCGDDMFADRWVISDIVRILNQYPDVGIVDRNYYQYIDGTDKVVAASREKEILISCVNPSGLGFRTKALIPHMHFTTKIYVEVATSVKNLLKEWKSKKLNYDTVAARLHKSNLATVKSYYKGSMLKNWKKLLGRDCRVMYDFKSNYICIKNRVGLGYLLKEIGINIRIQPKVLLCPSFYFFAVFAIITPQSILKRLTNWYRENIAEETVRGRYE